MGQRIVLVSLHPYLFLPLLLEFEKVVVLCSTEREAKEIDSHFGGSSIKTVVGRLSEPGCLQMAVHQLDTALCLNIQELLDPSDLALQNLHQILLPGGTAVFLVPTLPGWRRFLDKFNAPRPRFTRRAFLKKLDQDRFRYIRSFYFNSFGLFFPTHRTSPLPLRWTDRLANIWMRWEKVFRFPIGRSLLVVVTQTKLPARG